MMSKRLELCTLAVLAIAIATVIYVQFGTPVVDSRFEFSRTRIVLSELRGAIWGKGLDEARAAIESERWIEDSNYELVESLSDYMPRLLGNASPTERVIAQGQIWQNAPGEWAASVTHLESNQRIVTVYNKGINSARDLDSDGTSPGPHTEVLDIVIVVRE